MLPSPPSKIQFVIWAQGLAAFALWMAYGVVQARRSDQIRARIIRLSRTARAIAGAALLVVAAILLFVGLVGLSAAGAIRPDGMSAIGWLAVALLGLAFVHMQVYAMAMVVTVAQEGVTASARPSSTQEGSEGKRT
jgi:protein-S-isoprenylcysteine O-methyltransferase Ste14